MKNVNGMAHDIESDQTAPLYQSLTMVTRISVAYVVRNGIYHLANMMEITVSEQLF